MKFLQRKSICGSPVSFIRRNFWAAALPGAERARTWRAEGTGTGCGRFGPTGGPPRSRPLSLTPASFGGTVEEAVRALLAERFAKSRGCREGAVLLVNSFLMGLFDEQERMGERFEKNAGGGRGFLFSERGIFLSGDAGELTDLYQVRGRMNWINDTHLLCEDSPVAAFHGRCGGGAPAGVHGVYAQPLPGSGADARLRAGEELSQALERLLERRPINPLSRGGPGAFVWRGRRFQGSGKPHFSTGWFRGSARR